MARGRNVAQTLIRIAGDTRRALVLLFAGIWRRMLFRTTFIAITGSVGKTTCTQSIAAVLSTRFPTAHTRGGRNSHMGIARTIRSVRPWHRYAVVEIGIDGPGQMARLARAVRPDIVVWVSVARTHTMNFRTLEATAAEKSILVSSLRPGGIAVLNDDYRHISASQAPPGVQTLYYGTSTRSLCTASDVSGRWPERLAFMGTCGDETQSITTRLVGEHWVASILPSLLIGRLAGLSLAEASRALADLEPEPQRLSVVEIPRGPTFLRDQNASVDTLGPAMKVMEEATAGRRVLVMTDVTDSKRKPRRRLRQLGIDAARVADAAVFIGDHCERGAAGAIEAGLPADQVWHFYTIAEAAERLRSELRDGDLVMLRSRRVDHLDRIYLSLTGEVDCWKNYCPKRIACSDCRELVRR